jgi:hypothetical protein
MSAHTEGRIEAHGTLVAFSGKTSWIDIGGPSAEADARRLAACWNAFEGVETVAVEGFCANGGVPRLIAYGATVPALQVELAAARALLAEVMTAEDRMERGEVLGMDEVKSRYERIRTLLKGPQ